MPSDAPLTLRRSPGRLSVIGWLGLLLFSGAIIFSILSAAFMVAACYLRARVPVK